MMATVLGGGWMAFGFGTAVIRPWFDPTRSNNRIEKWIYPSRPPFEPLGAFVRLSDRALDETLVTVHG